MRRALLAIPLILAAGAAQAGPPAPGPTRQAADAALAAKLAYVAEIADQNRRSEALNAEVNRKNREVEARNVARRRAFETAMADHKAALAAQEAAAAQVQAAYQRDLEGWKAAVAACKAGDVTKCASAPPPAPAKTASR